MWLRFLRWRDFSSSNLGPNVTKCQKHRLEWYLCWKGAWAKECGQTLKFGKVKEWISHFRYVVFNTALTLVVTMQFWANLPAQLLTPVIMFYRFHRWGKLRVRESLNQHFTNGKWNQGFKSNPQLHRDLCKIHTSIQPILKILWLLKCSLWLFCYPDLPPSRGASGEEPACQCT